MRWKKTKIFLLVAGLIPSVWAAETLVEAESFSDKGGWKVDQQFVEQMGSPYLLAHGWGHPVSNAVTDVILPATGTYRVWVRTRDWVPEHPDDPGRFRVLIDGSDLGVDFGAELGTWHWQDGGVITATGTVVTLALHDLTGFDGRCDAIAFLSDTNEVPPNEFAELKEWRRTVLSEPIDPPVTESYDCVVVGGGIAGTAASIAAARGGISVALVQDRPYLGGNASQEIQLHLLGDDASDRNGIVASLDADPGYNNSNFPPYDEARLAVVNAETNITLVMPWRAYGVVTNSERRIVAVDARHIETGERIRLEAQTFIDCTGDGWLGHWAGAEWRMGSEARHEFNESLAPEEASTLTMGNTVFFRSYDTGAPFTFPEVPWAMDVAQDHSSTKNDWFWEYGLLLNTIDDAEHIRDYQFRANYGSFYNAKQNPANANLDIYWMGYIAGKRESRRIMGDHILTENDVRNAVFFEDAVVTERRAIDLHYPRNPPNTSYPLFYTYAKFTHINPYFIPFRSLYSRDVPNLMMAGRCFSCTRVGLGSPRVMRTGGQMGVATGFAASLCKSYGIDPRDVYRDANRMADLQALIGGVWPERPTPAWSVLDNSDTNNGVAYTGDWVPGSFGDEFYGADYRHDDDIGKGLKTVSYSTSAEIAGLYNISMWWPSGENRASNVPVEILTNEIPAVVDAPWLHNAAPDTVNNTDEMLVGRLAGSDYTRGLLSFDLSSIPAGATIMDVSLTLTAAQRDPASVVARGGTVGTDGLRIYQITESFNSEEVTWNEREDGLAWSTTGGTFGTTPLAIYDGEPYPDEITIGESIEFAGTDTFLTAVKEAVAGGHIELIVRTPSIESSYNMAKLYRFASESSTNAAWRPRLAVAYMAPGSGTLTHVDQRINGGQWNLIGSCDLREGQSVSVLISNEGTDGYVMADAVKFELDGYEADDADSDGLPNWWERWYFLDETAADPYADADFDGRNNYAEYRCGTDPNDPLSLLTVRGLLGVTDDVDDYVLRWSSASNKTYSVSASSNLADSAFIPVASNIVSTPPENTYTATVDRAESFYRIEVE